MLVNILTDSSLVAPSGKSRESKTVQVRVFLWAKMALAAAIELLDAKAVTSRKVRVA